MKFVCSTLLLLISTVIGFSQEDFSETGGLDSTKRRLNTFDFSQRIQLNIVCKPSVGKLDLRSQDTSSKGTPAPSDLIDVSGDVYYVGIREIDLLNDEVSHQIYIAESDENILEREGPIKNGRRTIYSYYLETNEHYVKTVQVEDTNDNRSGFEPPPITQKVSLFSRVILNSSGRDSVCCWNDSCTEYVRYLYHPDGQVKEVTDVWDVTGGTKNTRTTSRYDLLGNQISVATCNDDGQTKQANTYYLNGTKLITSRLLAQRIDNDYDIDTVNYSYTFDKWNWINRKKWLNGVLIEEVKRDITYRSDPQLNVSSKAFDRIYGCGTYGDQDVDVNGLLIKYDCDLKRIVCYTPNGRKKWSVKTKKLSDGIVVDLRDLYRDKYNLVVGFSDGVYVWMNSKNGRYKYLKRANN